MEEDKKFTILIVDDERSNIVVLSNILRASYTVLAAKDGPSAIEIAKKVKPDLILLDVIMPGMSGFEVLAELKKSDVASAIPVIFITGVDNSESEEKGLKLGAVDYITKPFKDSIVKLRVKTHRKIIEQMRIIEQLSAVDALTDIANRRSFDRQLNMEWNRQMRNQSLLSIMMLDIDDFKSINDCYGHAHGDEILKAVARVIKRMTKRSSDFSARWGGEEFAVLVDNPEMKEVLALAEKIRANVESLKIPYGDAGEIKVTISIGVYSVVPQIEMSLYDFCANADKALYSAKAAGKNRVECF